MTERGAVERAAERALWSTRLLLVGAVVGSALASAAMLWLTTVDLVALVGAVAAYTTAADRTEVRADIVADVVKIIDGYLLAAILMVVAFGLYELFVNRLEPARAGSAGPRLLMVRSLDDLKDKVAKLVVLILVVEFFQRSLRIESTAATDLLMLAAGIALVSLALALLAFLERRPEAPPR